MTQILWIPGPLPSLNELLNARGHAGPMHGKPNRRWCKYNEHIKKPWDAVIQAEIRRQTIWVMTSGAVWFAFRWMETTRRRDPDNVAAGGRKIILDALVNGGIIPGDGPLFVGGWTDDFIYDAKRAGVEVEMKGEHAR